MSLKTKKIWSVVWPVSLKFCKKSKKFTRLSCHSFWIIQRLLRHFFPITWYFRVFISVSKFFYTWVLLTFHIWLPEISSSELSCGAGKCGDSSDLRMPIKLFVIINVSKYFLSLNNGNQFSIVRVFVCHHLVRKKTSKIFKSFSRL